MITKTKTLIPKTNEHFEIPCSSFQKKTIYTKVVQESLSIHSLKLSASALSTYIIYIHTHTYKFIRALRLSVGLKRHNNNLIM